VKATTEEGASVKFINLELKLVKDTSVKFPAVKFTAVKVTTVEAKTVKIKSGQSML
jgi:hypothetical protein